MLARVTSSPFWERKIEIAILALATYLAMC
jgi:hypothetical protein